MKKIQTVTLKPVTSNDYRFLYKLLQERDQRANISHKKIPTYNQHIKFVKSKPYSKWYVIFYKNQRAGSIYLTKQNEIGIFIKKQMVRKTIRKESLEILLNLNPRKRYLANVSPRNKESIKFFKKNRFKLIQYTYELITTN